MVIKALWTLLMLFSTRSNCPPYSGLRKNSLIDPKVAAFPQPFLAGA